MNQPRPSLRTLDMLRGILAVYVLLGHCRWLLWAGHSAWMNAPHARWLEPVVYASASLRYGREAVMVFFVLSGFFIHLRNAGQPGAWPAMAATGFYRRRLHRLATPYVFALIVTLVLDSIGVKVFPTLYHAATGDPLTDAIFARTGYGSASVGPALVGMPSSLGYDFGTNGPLWSLAFEVVYYALYPAWLALRRSSLYLAFGIVPVACIVVGWFAIPLFPVLVLTLYPVWLTGAALAEILPRHQPSATAKAMAASIFVAGCALQFAGPGALKSTIAPILYGGALVTLCATLRPQAARLTPVRLFEYLGVRSYSIYIVHFPLVALMSAALFSSPEGRPFHGWYAAAGAMAAIGFGCLCFEVCERHFVHHRAPTARLAA